MAIFSKIWLDIKSSVSKATGYINWTTKKVLTEDDLNVVRQMLAKDYYIVLTRHNGHLSAYAIDFAHLVLTKRKGHYGHVVLNIEDEVLTDDHYQFIEATANGVHYSGFTSIFDQQIGSVCLLKPKSVSIDEWTEIVTKARSDLGKPYDFALNVSQSAALNCVELVRDALRGEDEYLADFPELEAMIVRYGENLDPHMLYECSDLEVVWEKRA
jgi:uncharacterized protein YycO